LLADAEPKLILDVATGTGDFAIEAMTLNPDRIIGVDISEGMLEMGRKKMESKGYGSRIELRSGDSENLPFEENKFDAVIVAFGVRNFENLEKGLAEMLRVIKPGGRAVVLEFSKPRLFPMKQLYSFYFRFMLPKIGRFFSRNASAYSYLPESVQAFPDGDEFLATLSKLGYKNATCRPLTFGISSLYTAIK
ncbi:MAG TPA: ubiquinone/menaquinone biosynthesis methyltransferase, partial [Cyclobacteriaceae bacterium]|nr:ubiquinone/menaquinone biosynthesis methyltransferase [Cyclobacteriaceae bacterium]